MISSKQHYPALDGLRGVAALSVILFHRRWMSPTHHLLDWAWMAVDFFFMLSGFVIALAYEERLRSGLSFWAFFWIRVRRLYPMIALGAAVGAAYYVVALRKEPDELPKLAASFLLTLLGLPTPSGLNFLRPSDMTPFEVDPPLWSLFFEMVVGAVFAALAPRLKSGLLVGIIVVSGAVECLVALEIREIDFRYLTFETFFRTMFPFFIGVLLYRLHIQGRLPKLRAGFVTLSIVLLLLFSPNQFDHWAPAYFLFAVAVVFPGVIVAAVNWRPGGQGMKSAALMMGALSYPAYAIHWPMYLWLDAVELHFHGPTNVTAPWYLAANVAVILAATYLALRFYDEPVRQFLSHRSKARRAGMPAKN